MSRHLEAELKAAAWAVKKEHLPRLFALGISRSTIAELGRHHYGFGLVNAIAGEDGLYVPGDGEPHLVLPVYESGELVDLVAFRSCDPEHWLWRTGDGSALGLEWGWGMLHNGEPLTISATPLDWLRAGCEGLCVLDWDAPELAIELADFAAIHCPDAITARLLKKSLTKPQRLPNISVGEIPLAA